MHVWECTGSTTIYVADHQWRPPKGLLDSYCRERASPHALAASPSPITPARRTDRCERVPVSPVLLLLLLLSVSLSSSRVLYARNSRTEAHHPTRQPLRYLSPLSPHDCGVVRAQRVYWVQFSTIHTAGTTEMDAPGNGVQSADWTGRTNHTAS